MVIQVYKCHHAQAAGMWAEADEKQDVPEGWGLTDLRPVDSGAHSNIFHISGQESKLSPLSYISTSQGRASAHVFLVQSSSPCYVKVYKRKGVHRIQCESSSGGHWGSHAHCCMKVYKMIRAVPSMSQLFPDIHDPSEYACSRAPPQNVASYFPEHLWTWHKPPNIALREWNNGRCLLPQPALPGLVDSYIVPPRPDGDCWQHRPSAKYPLCTLIGPTMSVDGICVYEWVNTETGGVVTIGPSSGIFIASDEKSKRHYAYDAKIMYSAMHSIITKGSSISQELEDLERVYRLQEEELGKPLHSLHTPSLPQFASHYHRFIQSQVRCACMG